MPELSHRPYIEFWQIGVRNVLVHLGTGEQLNIAESCHLKFSEVDGFAFLEPVDGSASWWANSRLQHSLHYATDTSDEDSFLISTTGVDQKAPYQLKTKNFSSRVVDAGDLHFEVYVFEVAPDMQVRGCLFWSMQQVQHYLGFGTDTRWASRSMSSWYGLLEIFSVPKSHIRRSAKSLAAIARQTGVSLDPAEYCCAGQEFSFSSLALLLVLAHFATRRDKYATAENRATAAKLLEAVFTKIVGIEQFTVAVSAYNSVEMVVSNLQVHSESVKKHGRCAFALVTEIFGDRGTVSFSEVFACCFARAVAPASRRSTTSKELGQQLCLSCVQCVVRLAEIKAHGGELFGESSLTLGIVREGKRAKRISTAFKIEVCSVVSETHGLKRPSGLASAECALVKKGRSVGSSQVSPLKPSSARWFTQDHMLQYLAACRRTFGNDTHMSLCLDGGMVGGEDLLIMTYWSPLQQRGCWLPPQVPQQVLIQCLELD